MRAALACLMCLLAAVPALGRECDSIARPLTAQVEPCTPPARPAQQPTARTAATAALGPNLPGWNMRTHCEFANRTLAIESAVMLRACIGQEERAYAILLREWNDVPPAARRTCLDQSNVMRLTSYWMLNACVQQELRALQDLSRRR